MIYLPREEFENLPIFEKTNLRRNSDGTLYKDFGYWRKDIIDGYIDYVNNLPPIEGLVQPIDLIIDENKIIYGYKMPEITDSISIEEYLKKRKKPQVDILSIMKSIFDILYRIHKYIILGDIRNANILITKLEAHFIDWDLGKPKGSSAFLIQYYAILINDCELEDNELSDTFKAFVSCLSLYYGKDVEDFADLYNIEELLEVLKSIQAHKHIIDYLKHLIDRAQHQETTPEFSFSEVIDSIDLPSTKEKKKLARILSR